jgi:hypothetical protein
MSIARELARRLVSVRPVRALPVALVLLSTGRPDAPALPPDQQVAGCSAPKYRQFDFWVGDWDAYDRDAPGSPVARNRVDAILDGCAIREVYEEAAGLVGQSFSIYDASRKVWHQTWVTNKGQLLVLEGGFRNGRVILQGTMRGADGRPALLRGTWWPEGDGVREVAESSPDRGKTWKPVFDLTFRRHPA